MACHRRGHPDVPKQRLKRRLAILDDFQRVALELADWSVVREHYDIDTFDRTIAVEDRPSVLRPYEVLVAMRERTPFPASLLERLPGLRLLVTTGMWNRAIDMEAAARLGVVVCGTESSVNAPVELAWALILGLARRVHLEDAALRRGEWQTGVGVELHGKTLAVLGLGRLGREMARIGRAFGMDVIAWSQNMTPLRAEEGGAKLVSRDEFFATADVLTVHVVLSDRTRGLIGSNELRMMKRTALLVNTSRGAIVDEEALAAALNDGAIGGAALDVYGAEPPRADCPLVKASRTLLTPHIGITTDRNYRMYYTQAAEDVLAFTQGRRLRALDGGVSPIASRA